MLVYPLQSFGIGDIIFSQTLVRELAGNDTIMWGVEAQFLEGLTRAYPDIHFVDCGMMRIDVSRREEYCEGGMRVLPIRWADALLHLPYECCMRAKYDLYGKDWQKWMDKAMWVRDKDREMDLACYMNPTGNPYILVNRYFGTSSQFRANIPVDNSIATIEMRTVPGYSLFDWAHLIENAHRILTVSTSIIYMLELLELKAKEVHLFNRAPIEPHFKNVDYLLKRQKYIFH